jgi:hypothetical protein
MPFGRVGIGRGFLEVSGGWRGQTLSIADARTNRGVFESVGRAGYGTQLRIEGETRWVYAPEGTYPFAGGSTVLHHGRLRLSGHAGKWLHSDLNDVEWGGRMDWRFGRTQFWTVVHRDAPDPLYLNTPRRSWSVGITRSLGRVAPVLPLNPVPHGGVTVRLRVADAEGDEVYVAGDFNGWQPVAMTREAGEWVLRLELAPGTYHYAFRNARGDWFVPQSTPGRRADDMGGYVALLMVS